MIGKPKYKTGDIVSFKLMGKEIITGEIIVVDRYGVLEDDTDVHYDIYSEERNCVYKHIKEEHIINN